MLAYYGWAGRDFIFGSELKALRCHPEFDRTIDRLALRAYAARTYIPAPRSIYRRVFKLPPGTILTLRTGDRAEPLARAPTEGRTGALELRRYWSYRDVVRRGLAAPIQDAPEALDQLEQALARAIRGQSLADVPVGAFLSGGIDSSTVVALYQKYSARPVRTYSIGFAESGFNEAGHAKAVAHRLGTVHHEHYVTVQEARQVIPLLSSMYDEPFADSSQIPTFLVSRFARRDVTVALTGDGGDELFGGYNRHMIVPRLWRRLGRVPRPIRSFAARPFSRLPPGFWSSLGRLVDRNEPFLGAKVQKGLRIARTARNIDDIYLSFLDEWSQEESPVLGADSLEDGFELDVGHNADDPTRMMYCDAVSYLPDDILTKVDRASMAVSLETRVPFLDHRVAALAATIPIEMKIDATGGKRILRQLLQRELPPALFNRPKAGFAIPIGEWIKGPLRPWAEELLDPVNMAAEGWFDHKIVQRRWKAHLAGQRESTPALWAILMFQSWLREESKDLALAA